MAYEPTALPAVIGRYLQAHSPGSNGERDTAALSATFSADATVVDEDHTYRSID